LIDYTFLPLIHILSVKGVFLPHIVDSLMEGSGYMKSGCPLQSVRIFRIFTDENQTPKQGDKVF